MLYLEGSSSSIPGEVASVSKNRVLGDGVGATAHGTASWSHGDSSALLLPVVDEPLIDLRVSVSRNLTLDIVPASASVVGEEPEHDDLSDSAEDLENHTWSRFHHS